jgi:hypothetical protein
MIHIKNNHSKESPEAFLIDDKELTFSFRNMEE